MKERPILFNSEMVRAILDGRKTQTRRVFKHQPPEDHQVIGPIEFTPAIEKNGEVVEGKDIFGVFDEWGEWGLESPFGQPGDRLWVRETFQVWDLGTYEYPRDQDLAEGPLGDIAFGELKYKAENQGHDGPWRPSIHMPRWASRLTLEITDIRVERLKDISEADAKAEGLRSGTKDGKLLKYGCDSLAWNGWDKDPRVAFKYLWGSVYGDEDFGCRGNPWVWVIEFKNI